MLSPVWGTSRIFTFLSMGEGKKGWSAVVCAVVSEIAEGRYFSRCCWSQKTASAIRAISSGWVNFAGSIGTVVLLAEDAVDRPLGLLCEAGLRDCIAKQCGGEKCPGPTFAK